MATRLCVLAFVLTCAASSQLRAEYAATSRPETVVLPSGTLRLHGLLWRPEGAGPFPAVLFNHGSGSTPANQAAQAAAVGPVFARHGYILLFVYRRGSGLSADQGTSAIELMDKELAERGWDARNRLLLELLDTDQLDDALAGLAFLRSLPDVDTRRVAIAGHSLGASLTILMAERDSAIRAAIAFSGSAGSWERSAALRDRLIAAVDRTSVPIFFIQAENDYSTAPTKVLSAEMKRLGKAFGVKICPPVGKTADDGHSFLFLKVDALEPEVFSFLAQYMGT